MKDDRNRTLMEGADESDVMKNTFPLPRKQGMRCRILPTQDFPDELKGDAQNVDLLSLAETLFSMSRFTDLCMLLLTYSGIGRGGEVKFLKYSSMFYDTTFNVLFAQWFQRKNLKTNPSGFVPDFEHPHLCVFFSLGCFWACHMVFVATTLEPQALPHAGGPCIFSRICIASTTAVSVTS